MRKAYSISDSKAKARKKAQDQALSKALEGTCIASINTNGEVVEITHRNGGWLIFWDAKSVYVYHNEKLAHKFTILTVEGKS